MYTNSNVKLIIFLNYKLYIYMYVFIYVYMYTCTHICACICMHMPAQIEMCHDHMHMHAQLYVSWYVYLNIYRFQTNRYRFSQLQHDTDLLLRQYECATAGFQHRRHLHRPCTHRGSASACPASRRQWQRHRNIIGTTRNIKTT